MSSMTSSDRNLGSSSRKRRIPDEGFAESSPASSSSFPNNSRPDQDATESGRGERRRIRPFVQPDGSADTSSPQVHSPRRDTSSNPSPNACPGVEGRETDAAILRRSATTSYDVLSILHRADVHNNPSLVDQENAVEQEQGEETLIPPAKLSQIWSSMRFVRSGHLTQQEGVDLMEYFSEYMAPLTPLFSLDLKNVASRYNLLANEPLLALTILTISSRYRRLSGPGSESRSNALHDALWKHLQHMVNHAMWGQESFRVNVPGTTNKVFQDQGYGTDSIHKMCPPSGGLRTLGTCEALLLLTEWHPRAIHFPEPEETYTLVDEAARSGASRPHVLAFAWLEPAWRSDRACWSMLSMAYSIAVELGLFDERERSAFGAREALADIWANQLYRKRANRVAQLLQVYSVHLSARLGNSSLECCF